MDTQHTPTPWTYGNGNITHGLVIYEPDSGKMVLHDAVYLSEEDAEFIVRACNAYDDLLEALERIAHGADVEPWDVIASIASAAIAKAKGD